jgi:HSP20 family protein
MRPVTLFEPGFPEMMEQMFRRFAAPAYLEQELEAMHIRLDVSEKDGVYTVRADLPGVKKEDIHVRVDGNLVQIDARTEDSQETKDKAGKVLRSERHYGALSRSLTLVDDVDGDKVQASYNDGVLTLTLPKKPASSKARQIQIE